MNASHGSSPVATVKTCPFCAGKLIRDGSVGRLVKMKCSKCQAKILKASAK